MLLDQPRLLLRAEGLAILAGAAVLYAEGDYSWLLFAILFLAPDLSFAAWAAGPRIGAAGYNVLHNLVLPIGLATYGVVDNSRNATAVGLIWLAHRHRPHARLRAQVSDDDSRTRTCSASEASLIRGIEPEEPQADIAITHLPHPHAGPREYLRNCIREQKGRLSSWPFLRPGASDAA